MMADVMAKQANPAPGNCLSQNEENKAAIFI